jgi:hypothetical protein
VRDRLDILGDMRMSCSDCPEPFEICVNEGSEVDYTATLKDKADAPVPLASLTDLKITLKDYETGEIINSRDALSVKNMNGGTFHATTGLFTMTFDEDDNTIQTATARKEKHIATFLATWTGGQHQWDVIVRVQNLGLTN